MKGRKTNTIGANTGNKNEQGTTLIITLLVLTLLLGFVALALSRTGSEAKVSYNDAAEARTMAVSEAGLEDATRDFATILENKLNPTSEDLKIIKNNPVDSYSGTYNITKNLTPIGTSKLVTIQSGEFQGLYSLRDEWQINVKAQELATDVTVETMRRFYNNRIPLFQFGAFYQDDLELNRPPLFTFSGKVHSNSNIFISASPANQSGGIYFQSKVTAAGEIVNDLWKTGTKLVSGYDDTGDVYFPDASGDPQKLTVGNGSVKCVQTTGGGVLKEIGGRGRAFPYPTCTKNAGWATFSQRFEGNLRANTQELRLPLDRLNIPLIEIMRRGKNVGDKARVGNSVVNVDESTQDNGTVSKERYANKQGMRISLADSKDKLPGCVNKTGKCGVQLDASLGSSLGYQPLPMSDSSSYKTTAVNGNRLAVSGSREVWIKIETVDFDYDAEVPITKDITEDILSLGVTEPIDSGVSGYVRNRDGSSYGGQDSRSIIKIQRFIMPGAALPKPTSNSYSTNFSSRNYAARFRISSDSSRRLEQYSQCVSSGNTFGLAGDLKVKCVESDKFATPLGTSTVSDNEIQHFKMLCFNTSTECNKTSTEKYLIVPYPIQMYDSREGNRKDTGSGVSSGYVYRNGVMSLIDIDVANLRQFLNGAWDGKLPTTTEFAKSNGNIGLKSTDIPDNRGWVLYFSDRRGDYDFDGRYTMEDVNPNTSSLVAEDLDNNGKIDTPSGDEAPSQDSTIDAGFAAVTDQVYYRRGVRLINGVTLPGIYDKLTPANTKGFTVASENGIYVEGNYNVTGVSLPGGNAPAESTAYAPQDTTLHIPASIVGDSVTILSNSWNDANSFINAFDTTDRVASNTQVRFAMIAGDSLTARTASTTAGDFDGLNGGLHNFMRFLETWKNKRLNYSGSLINLYNSFNNNGKWKCCTTVYDPPIRDWTFDTSFTDPNRLPPGSPFVYYISFTGFQRVNN